MVISLERGAKVERASKDQITKAKRVTMRSVMLEVDFKAQIVRTEKGSKMAEI